MYIPIYQPCLNGNEKTYVNDCLDSAWISSKGSYVERFQNDFSKLLGVRHASAVSNGTTALHVALLALGVGPGDEVIVPSLTYIASVNAISYTGAKPVFVDSLLDSWQLDPEDVGHKITTRTKAIMAVHLYGYPCPMDELLALCQEHDLFLIEDCAEALGTRYKGAPVGGFGDIATFSFYGNKTITTGEGGMVVTNREDLYERVELYKGQGLAKHRQYWHEVIGYNYRMTNICAAIGVAQLEQLATFLDEKQNLVAMYNNELNDLPVTAHAKCEGNSFHSYWMYSILTDDPADREPLRALLAQRDVETRPLFYPIHQMPMYPSDSSFPRAEYLSARGLNLPSWPKLKPDQVFYICQAIKDYFACR